MKNNGLQRFIESYSVSGTLCQKIPVTQELQERYHIQEAVQRLQEDGRLDESASSVPNALYRFPISRFNHVNHNKRLYPRNLWENVIRKQENEWRGRVGLADHPPEDSDGEFKNACVIWHDMEIDDDSELVWGTGSFVGPYGRLAQEIVDKGGRVGFSSSGFGELTLDGKTVNPDTYQLERVADVVLNPSQDVFGDSSNALNIEYSRGNIPESKTRTTESTNYSIDNGEGPEANLRIKENRMDRNTEARPVSKLEEKKFRRDIQVFLEDASRMENPQARLQELEEIVTYFEEGVAPDLREQVETRILEEKKNLETLLTEAQLTKKTFGVENSEQLKMGVALLAEEIKVAEAEAKDWESIAMVLKENNGKLRKALAEAHAKMNTLPAPRYVEELLERVKNLETQRKRNLYAHVAETKEKDAALQNADALIEGQNTMIAKLKGQVSQLTEASQKAEKQLAEMKTARGSDSATVKQLKETVAELEETAKVQEDTIKVLEEREARLKARLDEVVETNQQLNEGFELYKKELQEANTPKFIPSATERIGSHLNFREGGGAAVEAYWTDLVARHGEAIAPFERQIRGAKTYREASAAYIRILPTIDEDNATAINARLPESTSISRKERQEMLEKAGMQFGGHKDITQRMPKGWQ